MLPLFGALASSSKANAAMGFGWACCSKLQLDLGLHALQLGQHFSSSWEGGCSPVTQQQQKAGQGELQGNARDQRQQKQQKLPARTLDDGEVQYLVDQQQQQVVRSLVSVAQLLLHAASQPWLILSQLVALRIADPGGTDAAIMQRVSEHEEEQQQLNVKPRIVTDAEEEVDMMWSQFRLGLGWQALADPGAGGAALAAVPAGGAKEHASADNQGAVTGSSSSSSRAAFGVEDGSRLWSAGGAGSAVSSSTTSAPAGSPSAAPAHASLAAAPAAAEGLVVATTAATDGHSTASSKAGAPAAAGDGRVVAGGGDDIEMGDGGERTAAAKYAAEVLIAVDQYGYSTVMELLRVAKQGCSAGRIKPELLEISCTALAEQIASTEEIEGPVNSGGMNSALGAQEGSRQLSEKLSAAAAYSIALLPLVLPRSRSSRHSSGEGEGTIGQRRKSSSNVSSTSSHCRGNAAGSATRRKSTSSSSSGYSIPAITKQLKAVVEAAGAADGVGLYQQAKLLSAAALAASAQLPLEFCCNDLACINLKDLSDMTVVMDKGGGVCKGCGLAAYCSRACQECDWERRHKHVCKRMQKMY